MRKYDPQQILDWLRYEQNCGRDGWYSPTAIGVAVYGVEDWKASSIACRALWPLVEAGLVEKSPLLRGRYRLARTK